MDKTRLKYFILPSFQYVENVWQILKGFQSQDVNTALLLQLIGECINLKKKNSYEVEEDH